MPEKIRAAMLGTGHAHAAGKLRVLQKSPDYEVVGVHEPDPELRKQREKQSIYRNVTWLTLDQLLGDDSIKLVAVETHVWDNLTYAAKTIEAGKHIHLDKPPGNDLPALERLFEAAARKHLYIQMGYMWRYHDGFRFIGDAVKKSLLGDVYLIRAMINSVIRPPSRIQLARYRGGMMFELGCHLLDQVLAILGQPKKVIPSLRHDGADNDELADNTLAVLEFDHAMAVLSSATPQPHAHAQRCFEVLGTGGTVRMQPIESPKVQLILDKPGQGFKPGPQNVPVKNNQRYVGDFQEFARIIRDRTTPSFTPKQDLLVQRVLLQACGQTGPRVDGPS